MRVHVKFVGNQDHLVDGAAQMASVWLCIVHQTACSEAGWLACVALTSMPRIWLQHVQPGEARYQQRRIRPYISVAHPRRATKSVRMIEMGLVVSEKPVTGRDAP